MCYDEVVLLISLFDIRAKDLSNFSSSDHAVHAWHVDVHHDEPICILVVLNALLTFHECFFSTDGLIDFDFDHAVHEELKNTQCKDRVIHDQDVSYVGVGLVDVLDGLVGGC